MPNCMCHIGSLDYIQQAMGSHCGLQSGNGTFSFTVLENLTDKNVGDILRRVSPGIVVSVKGLLE